MLLSGDESFSIIAVELNCIKFDLTHLLFWVSWIDTYSQTIKKVVKSWKKEYLKHMSKVRTNKAAFAFDPLSKRL